jgi:imidazolonepropionase-like amidohydrolase
MIVNAARLLGVDSASGAIAPGMAADIIAMPGNPIDSIQALKHVAFVMKNGVVHRESK